ncbi:MAG: hypothetical protein U9Q71_08255 [Pseudomonadota bacterium]|nr:hypothetical protein [Pseudomonadota bacterium]
MGARRRYRRQPHHQVTAARLDPDAEGVHYRKWGGLQRGKPGDWLVDNGDEIYTVDDGVFCRTYREIGQGGYVKTTPVWAEKTIGDGAVRTKEGISRYKAGDYLVSNDEDGRDVYCVSAGKFETLYEIDE